MKKKTREWRVLASVLEMMHPGEKSMLDKKRQEEKRGLKKEVGCSKQSVE